MIRVCVFDDNCTLLEGMVLLFKSEKDFLLSGAYSNARHAIAMIAKDAPDVVLMDIQMPGISGIEAVRSIKATFPNIHILMQTVFEDDDKIFDAVCAGASGYILKSTPPDKLLEAIKEVHEGGSPMSPVVSRKVLQLFQQQFAQTPDDFHPLTAKEKEILSLMVNGYSYKMIAGACGISFNTVHTHIKNVYEKLHVNSAIEAVAKAIRQRLV